MGYMKAIKSWASVMRADAAPSVYRFLKILSFLTLDFDECQSNQTNSCSQLCINAPGSYSCACQNGYSLNDDKESCDGKYDNTHHYHRQLVIVFSHLSPLGAEHWMANGPVRLMSINRSCINKVWILYLRSERFAL